MKKIMIATTIAYMLFATTAAAHVMNEQNTFEDLALTEAAEEIVLLSGLGIVSALDNGYAFKPADILLARDLAAWAANYYGLHGETTIKLAQQALEEGLVSTIDGNATYALVNEVFFEASLQLENEQATMTREQFALFVVQHAMTQVNGQSLIQKAGYTEGPTGKIEHAQRVTKKTSSGSETSVYEVTIEGQVYELGMHPRVIADSADPTVWVGETIAESWYGPNATSDHHHNADENIEEQQALQFIVVGDEPLLQQEAPVEEAQPQQLTQEVESAFQEVVADTEKESTNTTWLYVGVLVLVAIIIGIVVRMRNK